MISFFQQAILLGLGLQHKTIETLEVLMPSLDRTYISVDTTCYICGIYFCGYNVVLLFCILFSLLERIRTSFFSVAWLVQQDNKESCAGKSSRDVLGLKGKRLLRISFLSLMCNSTTFCLQVWKRETIFLPFWPKPWLLLWVLRALSRFFFPFCEVLSHAFVEWSDWPRVSTKRPSPLREYTCLLTGIHWEGDLRGRKSLATRKPTHNKNLMWERTSRQFCWCCMTLHTLT